MRPASGTWGSGLALCCCALLELAGAGKLGCGLLALTSFALGVPAAQAYGERKGRADHANIVIDEFAAQSGVLVFAPAFFIPASVGEAKGLAGWVAAFMLFRLFDIFKPFPARRLDERWKNGWGVMLDDVAAGVWAVGFLWLLEMGLGSGGVWNLGWNFWR